MHKLSIFVAGAATLLATEVAMAQSGGMMNGNGWGYGHMGGYGGYWPSVLLVIIVVGLIAWIFNRDGK